MKKSIITMGLCLGLMLTASASFAFSKSELRAFDVFGVSSAEVHRLIDTRTLDLRDDEDARVFLAIEKAVQIRHLSNLDIAKSDAKYIPSFLNYSASVQQTGEVEAASTFLLAIGFCEISVVGIFAQDLYVNSGVNVANGWGFVDFHKSQASILNLADALDSHSGVPTAESEELRFIAASQYLGMNSVATYSTCGDINLDANKCCDTGDDGVAQVCNDATDKECGIFRRNGTTVCRIGSDSC